MPVLRSRSAGSRGSRTADDPALSLCPVALSFDSTSRQAAGRFEGSAATLAPRIPVRFLAATGAVRLGL